MSLKSDDGFLNGEEFDALSSSADFLPEAAKILLGTLGIICECLIVLSFQLELYLNSSVIFQFSTKVQMTCFRRFFLGLLQPLQELILSFGRTPSSQLCSLSRTELQVRVET